MHDKTVTLSQRDYKNMLHRIEWLESRLNYLQLPWYKRIFVPARKITVNQRAIQ